MTFHLAIGLALLTMLAPATGDAGCGCDKPPPPLAPVRPFAGWLDQKITLIDARLILGKTYTVTFESIAGGDVDSSRGRPKLRADFADGVYRPHLRIRVPNVGFGPSRITVSNTDTGAVLYALAPDQFTVIAEPIALHDVAETSNLPEYRTGVDAEGTLYVAVDLSQVNAGTRFLGAGLGLPVSFQSSDVAMYNDQGVLMQVLDPAVPGLFQLFPGNDQTSSVLSYRRHEFSTYKRTHRQDDAFATEDGEWHADGTRHVNHDHIVIAVHGTLPNGGRLAAGATPAFQLALMSTPEGD